MSLYYGMHSMYDKDQALFNLEAQLHHFKQELKQNGITATWVQYCEAQIELLERQIAAISGNPIKHSGLQCECGATAAGFETHVHYCPLFNTAKGGGESR